MNGTIELFLTKGTILQTDYVHESSTFCGIHIHTHHLHVPSRKKNDTFWPPSGQDIQVRIRNILSRKSRSDPQNNYYDYVFDGYNLWYFKPNLVLIDEFLYLSKMNPSKLKENKRKLIQRDELLDACRNNANNLTFDLIEKNINVIQYIDGMSDLLMQKLTLHYPEDEVIGIDMGIISNLKNKSIIIPDTLICRINERRDKHIILPDSGLLSSQDLDFLYQKCIQILESRSYKKTQESIF